jgi:hypothetical protein
MKLQNRVQKPNALKHGAFSKAEILPWEDRSEFEELRRSLIADLQPAGPFQEDCVVTIANLLWRKRRVVAKRNFEAAAALERVENRELWENPPPLFDTEMEGAIHSLGTSDKGPRPRLDDYRQLLSFSVSLFRFQRETWVKMGIHMLPAEFSKHLNEKVPREDFETTSAWIVRLKTEVDSVLLPAVRGRVPDTTTYFERAANFLTGERLGEDLALEERLDAGIDRALKRLWQLKMARQIEVSRPPKLVTSTAVQDKLPDDDAV